jgi:hypothetical protein
MAGGTVTGAGQIFAMSDLPNLVGILGGLSAGA